MPIDLNHFEEADALGDPPTSVQIIRFLVEHDEQAFTRREISDAIDVNLETVGTNLTRLKDRDLVRHREPYWAIADDRSAVIETLRALYDDDSVDDILRDAIENDRSEGIKSPNDCRDSDSSQPNPTGNGDVIEAVSSSVTASERYEDATRAFVARVRETLDNVIEELYLFGSVARGTATAESDVDVLAVITDDADYTAVDDQLLDLAYDIQLEFGVRIEVHSIRANEFAARSERGDPFIQRVIEDGQIYV